MIQSAAFWILLAVSPFVYWVLPRNLRDGFLALVSFAYLASLEPVVVTTVVAWVLLFFYLAPHAVAAGKTKRLVTPGLILAILTFLIYHKYIPQLRTMFSALPETSAPIVPLGISYFTFKLIHYAVEVSRGNISDRSLQRFASYIFLFPIFTAGPIERFDHFLANRDHSWKIETTVEGLTRIAHGLIKMFLFARLLEPRVFSDKIATFADLPLHLRDMEALEVWGFLALAFLYAYMEFSAYSDIAIGASRLFGFRILENFRFPIVAWNISEFWRRWHMTLAGWCQSYVYLPMIGLTRQPYLAVYCTFVAMGLWHGASWNWLFWGLYHATGVSVFLTWNRFKRYRRWQSSRSSPLRYAGIPLTFAFVTGSYAFSSTAGQGAWPALRVFAKLLSIDL